MKLRDILKESEDRGLTNEVKKHLKSFLHTTNIKNQWIENLISLKLLKLWVVLEGVRE